MIKISELFNVYLKSKNTFSILFISTSCTENLLYTIQKVLYQSKDIYIPFTKRYADENFSCGHSYYLKPSFFHLCSTVTNVDEGKMSLKGHK